MADENNQDMSMEDILSSIKNILEEDAGSAHRSSAPAEDDILELSSDMRLEEPGNESINLDAELNDVKLPELNEEIVSPVVEDAAVVVENEGEPQGVRLGWEDFESDPFYEEPNEPDVAEVIELPAAEIAEPVIEPEPVVEAEPVIEPAVEIEPEPVAEPEIIEEPEPAIEPEIMAEPVIEPEPVVIEPEPIVEPEVVAKPEMIEEPEMAAEPEENLQENNAVDVSASIISNFAKMFSHEEPKPVETPAEQPAVSAEPVTVLGDGARTIEDVVSSVIRQIIGDEVAANWRNGLDYEAFAREEISRQTKEWLDANLPAVVETVVKKEIERVMVKAGTNQ